MNLGVSILYQKSVPEDPGPFSFLKPLDTKGWVRTLFPQILMIEKSIENLMI